MAASDLYDACLELLGACYDALGQTAAGAPDRAFVSPGIPAWDCCPQLTVHAGGPAQADTAPLQPPLQPGHRVQARNVVNLVTMTATIIRCAPTVETKGQVAVAPSGVQLDACAQVMLADCWAIWNHLATVKRDGGLFPPDTREMFFDPAVSLGAAGGCVGWEMQFRVQLGGYRTTP